MKNPLISVIMPVYNAEKYLAQAIQSVLNQTYPNWEIIAIDDNSTDASVAILNSFQANDKRIRYYKNDKDKGAGSCRNIAIEKASGQYLMFLDADDFYHSELIQNVANASLYEPDIIEWPFSICNEDGTNKKLGWGKNYPTGWVSLKNYWVMYATCLWCRAFRKRFIIDNNIKNSHVSSGQDNNFTIPAFEKAKNFYFINLPDAYIYRQISHSLSHKISKPQIKIHSEIFKILKEDLIRLKVYDEQKFNLMKFCGASYSLTFNKSMDYEFYKYTLDIAKCISLKDFDKYDCGRLKKIYKKVKYYYWFYFFKDLFNSKRKMEA